MTVKEIVKGYLEGNGFDGLHADVCACECSNLMSCESDCIEDCEAGYKVPCPGEDCEYGGDCEWHIGPGKPEDKDETPIEKCGVPGCAGAAVWMGVYKGFGETVLVCNECYEHRMPTLRDKYVWTRAAVIYKIPEGKKCE